MADFTDVVSPPASASPLVVDEIDVISLCAPFVPSGVAVVGARASALNAVEVTFDAAPKAIDSAAIDDALNPDNWSLEVREPFGATLRLVQFVELVSSVVFRVFVDGPLTPEATYRIIVNTRVVDQGGDPIVC